MTTYTGSYDGSGIGRVAVVCGRFNDFITERLLAGARDGLLRHGVDDIRHFYANDLRFLQQF